MSNFVLTTVAYHQAQKSMDVLIKEYNNPELTQKGKRDCLLNSIAIAFMGGFKLADDEIKLLENKISALKRILLLTHPELGSEATGDLTVKQWAIFTREFPGEG